MLLESTRETARALQKFFDDAGAALRGVDRDLAAMEEYEMASRAQAEMRMEQSARTLQEAFDGLSEDPFGVEPPAPPAHTTRGIDGTGDGVEVADDRGDAAGTARGGDDRAECATTSATTTATTTATSTASNRASSSGRSADASIRASLASGREALDASGRLGVGAIRKGWLNERNPGKFGGWTRRYFVLDGVGRLMVYGRRGGANTKSNNGSTSVRGGAGTGGNGSTSVLGVSARTVGVTAGESSRGHSRAASEIEIDDETFAALDADAEETQRRARADAERRGGLVGAAGSVARGIGTGLGAAWSFVKQGAAPDPNAPGRRFEPAEDAVPAVDLTLSCVKPGADEADRSTTGRPFCFRVISPTASLLLQAESEAEASAWVSDLQGTIAELIGAGPKFPSFGRRGVGADAAPLHRFAATTITTTTVDLDPREVLAAAPGNDACADCGGADPDWASMNLCVVVCQRCAGAHRHLGAHVSKVRSLALDRDAWTRPALDLFLAVGNDRANDVWEARRRVGTVAPKVLRLEAAIKDASERRRARMRGEGTRAPAAAGVRSRHPRGDPRRRARGRSADRAHVRARERWRWRRWRRRRADDAIGVLTRIACASADRETPKDGDGKDGGAVGVHREGRRRRGDHGAALIERRASGRGRTGGGDARDGGGGDARGKIRAGGNHVRAPSTLRRRAGRRDRRPARGAGKRRRVKAAGDFRPKDDGEVKAEGISKDDGEVKAGEVEKGDVEDARDDDDDAWIRGDDE